MSMWKRGRHRDPRSFREELGSRVLGKIGLLYWLFVLGWVVARSVAYGFSLLVSTTPGRVVGVAAVVLLLVDASYGSDPVTLPVDTAVVLLAAAVAGYAMWTQRRRWEEHLRTIVYDVVPGHSSSQPEVFWFPPSIGRLISGGRWLRTWDFVFRIPGGMSEGKQAEVDQDLRSRLPAATGSSWAFVWDWRRGVARATLMRDLPGAVEGDEPLRKESGAGTAPLAVEATGEAEKAATRIPLGRSREREIVWDCSNLFGSIIIAGAPGGGKSVVTLAILAHCFLYRLWWRFFSAVARHAYIPDEVPYPEESRTVETRDSREIERGERMTDGRDHSENRTPEEQRNGEAKFASPEENSVGIGYYDEHGNRLSPEEFNALVARDARLRDDEEDDR